MAEDASRISAFSFKTQMGVSCPQIFGNLSSLSKPLATLMEDGYLSPTCLETLDAK